MSANVMQCPSLRDLLEPLGTARRGNGQPLSASYLPVPLRREMLVALRLLSLRSADPDAKPTDPRLGDSAVRKEAEDIIEAYVRDEFKRRIGCTLKYAFNFVSDRCKSGASDADACREFFSQIESEEANEQ